MPYVASDDRFDETADWGTLENGSRLCRECRVRQDMEEFYRAGSYRRRVCRGCVDKQARARRAADPRKAAHSTRRTTIKRKYGLTPEAFETLLLEQNYRCRICWSFLAQERTHVDHDHASGEVRGLLCVNCNVGIGHLRDSPEILLRAATYLQTHVREQEIRAVLAKYELELQELTS